MHPNEALLHRFYEAFNRRDAGTMGACYADDVRFSDPAFPDLRGDRARGMWTMLCAEAKELKIELVSCEANDDTGRARWEAFYPFGPSGRRVHNVIDAAFVFRDGLIVEHRDRFDFWRWSRQALGPVGLLLGWTPLLRAAVRGQANKGLDRFLAARSKRQEPVPSRTSSEPGNSTR